MTWRRTSAFFLTVFLVCAPAFAGEPAGEKSLTVRTFAFKHKEADKAAGIIKALMSAEGSISLQPATNSLVISDHAENMKAIAAALAQYDAPAQGFRLALRLIAASRVDPAAAPKVTADLKDLAAKLSMLRFNVFESLGEADVVGREGDPGFFEMPSGYRAEFRFGEFDPTTETIKISDLKLSRLQKDQLTQLYKTSLNLKIGQTVILTTSKVPQSERALMIVVTAKR